MLSSIFWQDLRSEQTHERGNITHVWLCSNDPNRERAKGRHYKKEINIEGKNKGKTINNTVMNHLIYSFFFKLCRCGNIHIIIATIKSECFFWYRKLTFLLSYNILLFFFFFSNNSFYIKLKVMVQSLYLPISNALCWGLGCWLCQYCQCSHSVLGSFSSRKTKWT